MSFQLQFYHQKKWQPCFLCLNWNSECGRTQSVKTWAYHEITMFTILVTEIISGSLDWKGFSNQQPPSSHHYVKQKELLWTHARAFFSLTNPRISPLQQRSGISLARRGLSDDAVPPVFQVFYCSGLSLPPSSEGLRWGGEEALGFNTKIHKSN